MSNSELQEKGLALRKELFGEDYARQLDEATYQDPVMQKFRDVKVFSEVREGGA